jgi:hypothetical protein
MATSTVETTQNRTAAPAKGGTTPKAPPPVEHENTWDYIRSIPKSDWDENVFMYLFRTQPITDRKRTGNNLNIMKYTQPIDVDHVVKTYGSGGYRILLERYDPATRKTKAERDFYFDILNFDYPPRVPYGEWVDDERNKQWLWAKPALEAEHQKLLQKNGTLPAPGTPGTDSISQATGMFRAAVDAVRQLRPDETPEHQETLATTVIRLMEANHKEAIAASNPAVLFPLMKELLNSLAPKQDTTLVDILREELRAARSQPPPKSAIDQLVELEPVVTKLRGLFGGRGGQPQQTDDRPTDWWDVLKSGVERLVDVAPQIVQAITWKTAGGSPPVNPWQMTPAPQLAAAHSPFQNGAQPTAQAAVTEQEKQQLYALFQKYGQLIQECLPFLLDHYKNDLGGFAFRDWFLDRKGSNLYAGMRDEIGKEKLIMLAKLNPQLWAQLEPHEEFSIFVDEFFTPVGQEPDDTDDDDEEDEDNEGAREPIAADRPARVHQAKPPREF